jgi:hypothetical protein
MPYLFFLHFMSVMLGIRLSTGGARITKVCEELAMIGLETD